MGTPKSVGNKSSNAALAPSDSNNVSAKGRRHRTQQTAASDSAESGQLRDQDGLATEVTLARSRNVSLSPDRKDSQSSPLTGAPAPPRKNKDLQGPDLGKSLLAQSEASAPIEESGSAALYAPRPKPGFKGKLRALPGSFKRWFRKTNNAHVNLMENHPWIALASSITIIGGLIHLLGWAARANRGFGTTETQGVPENGEFYVEKQYLSANSATHAANAYLGKHELTTTDMGTAFRRNRKFQISCGVRPETISEEASVFHGYSTETLRTALQDKGIETQLRTFTRTPGKTRDDVEQHYEEFTAALGRKLNLTDRMMVKTRPLGKPKGSRRWISDKPKDGHWVTFRKNAQGEWVLLDSTRKFHDAIRGQHLKCDPIKYIEQAYQAGDRHFDVITPDDAQVLAVHDTKGIYAEELVKTLNDDDGFLQALAQLKRADPDARGFSKLLADTGNYLKNRQNPEYDPQDKTWLNELNTLAELAKKHEAFSKEHVYHLSALATACGAWNVHRVNIQWQAQNVRRLSTVSTRSSRAPSNPLNQWKSSYREIMRSGDPQTTAASQNGDITQLEDDVIQLVSAETKAPADTDALSAGLQSAAQASSEESIPDDAYLKEPSAETQNTQSTNNSIMTPAEETPTPRTVVSSPMYPTRTPEQSPCPPLPHQNASVGDLEKPHHSPLERPEYPHTMALNKLLDLADDSKPNALNDFLVEAFGGTDSTSVNHHESGVSKTGFNAKKDKLNQTFSLARKLAGATLDLNRSNKKAQDTKQLLDALHYLTLAKSLGRNRGFWSEIDIVRRQILNAEYIAKENNMDFDLKGLPDAAAALLKFAFADPRDVVDIKGEFIDRLVEEAKAALKRAGNLSEEEKKNPGYEALRAALNDVQGWARRARNFRRAVKYIERFQPADL